VFALILSVSIALGVAFFATIRYQPFKFDWLIKGLSIYLLSILAFTSLTGPVAVLLSSALVFSAIGDILIAIDKGDGHYFKFGLVAFLITHILYIVIFCIDDSSLSTIYLIPALCWPLIAINLFIYLLPLATTILIPVTVYVTALCTMVVSAMLLQSNSPLIVVGALLFFASDSILAINTLKKPIAHSRYITWATYYVAQVFITLGVIISVL
jgi:uncharacterized membrane protein YhhN